MSLTSENFTQVTGNKRDKIETPTSIFLMVLQNHGSFQKKKKLINIYIGPPSVPVI